MAWLDKDRTPVRFVLVTSVASGLIVAVLWKALNIGITDSAAFMWFVLTIAGAAAASCVVSLGILRARRRPTLAFFITSAFSHKYYVNEFAHMLHNRLDRDEIDLVLKVPDHDHDYDASVQSHHLSRLLRRRHDYIGGIIFPAEVHRTNADLKEFCRNSGLPVVFTDVEPFDNEEEYPENTAYIGYDTGQLGEEAGGWLAENLRDRERPHVLIIASTEHSARQRRCEKVLRDEFTDVSITTEEWCAFDRLRARDAVQAHIHKLNPGQRLDAIFCTNDEMALGAVDALSSSSLSSPESLATQNTMVVGIDGTQEAKTLIDTPGSPLRATVVQDTHRLAGYVVDGLQKMHRGGPVPKRTILSARIHEATAPTPPAR
jgi:ribose transport system substrate-binding protein